MSKPSKLGDLPRSDSDFWEGADRKVCQPETHGIEECKHHFVAKGGNIIQCRYCGFGGGLKVKKDSVTLRDGKTYEVFAD